MQQKKHFGQHLLFFFFLALLLLPFQGEAGAYHSRPIKIFINNQPVAADVPPLLVQGRALVPFRPILEALGARVQWSASERKVTARRDNLLITLYIDNTVAYLQQEPVTLEVPARIQNGRTLTPLRFLAESLGATVHWDEEERTIYIYSPDPISFSLSPQEVHLLPGQTQSLKCKAIFPPYLEREVNTEGISWSVKDEGLVEIKEARVTALHHGQTTLTASYRGLEASLQVHIYPTSLEQTTLLSRDGYATITLPQEHDLLQVKVQKQNKSYSFLALPPAAGQSEGKKKILLPYGEGTYHIDMAALENGEWVNVQQYIVHNPYPVSPSEEYLYPRGYFNTTITEPSTTVDVVDSIHLVGESDAEYFIVRLRHTDDLDNPRHFSYYFPDGKIDGYLYLPLGEGLYHVAIFASSTYEGTYRNTWDFYVNNKGSRLREDLIPTGEIQSDHPEIRKLAAEITAGIARDYNKSMAIHNWVASHIAYDTDSLLNDDILWEENTALATLRQKKAVCTGYANLTAALHRAVGIPAVVIEGIVRNAGNSPVSRSSAPDEPNHAWNEVFVEGQWIILDTTWDAGYLNPETNKFVPNMQKVYFDPHPLVFSYTHTAWDH